MAHQSSFPTLHRTVANRSYLAGSPPQVDLSKELKLHSNAREREKFDNLADLYAIIITMDHLEKAYVRDAVTADEYSQSCNKLIAQYKTALGLVQPYYSDVVEFMEQYQVSCPAAMSRFKIGVPATVEHSHRSSQGNNNNQKYTAELVQHYITLMDQIKLNMVAVDQLHPSLADLLETLNKITTLPADFEGGKKIKTWLVILNGMRANDELDEDQARQLLFDLEQSHNLFYRSLSS